MPWTEISLLFVLLSAVISIVFYTLKTGISPMPSSGKARREIMNYLEQHYGDKQGEVLVDLGCGWGHLIIPLARRFPHHQVVGYELSVLPWLFCFAVKYLLRLDNLSLHRKNFLRQPLPENSILLSFLHPKGMKKLASHLEQQSCRKLISIFFALPNFQAEQVMRLKDLYQTPVYIYPLQK